MPWLGTGPGARLERMPGDRDRSPDGYSCLNELQVCLGLAERNSGGIGPEGYRQCERFDTRSPFLELSTRGIQAALFSWSTDDCCWKTPVHHENRRWKYDGDCFDAGI